MSVGDARSLPATNPLQQLNIKQQFGYVEPQNYVVSCMKAFVTLGFTWEPRPP